MTQNQMNKHPCEKGTSKIMAVILVENWLLFISLFAIKSSTRFLSDHKWTQSERENILRQKITRLNSICCIQRIHWICIVRQDTMLYSSTVQVECWMSMSAQKKHAFSWKINPRTLKRTRRRFSLAYSSFHYFQTQTKFKPTIRNFFFYSKLT